MDDYEKTRVTLLQRIRAENDEQPWEEFIDIYSPFIYAVIRKMNISQHDAEDLTQHVLLLLWKKLPGMDLAGINKFRNWIAAVTKNAVIDYIRKRSRDADKLEQAARSADLAFLNSINVPDIDGVVQAQWMIHITNLALKNIRPLFSARAIEVFQLSLQGLSIQEIAERLSIAEKSVSQMKSRVKKRLIGEVELLRGEIER